VRWKTVAPLPEAEVPVPLVGLRYAIGESQSLIWDLDLSRNWNESAARRLRLAPAIPRLRAQYSTRQGGWRREENHSV